MTTDPRPTDPRPVVLVSACLAGVSCRYHGRHCGVHSRIKRLIDAGRVRVITICPEVDAGLPTPRPPSRVDASGCVTCAGQDVTQAFVEGARLALATAVREGAAKAYLTKGSPSCDRDSGLTGRLLTAAGVQVIRV